MSKRTIIGLVVLNLCLFGAQMSVTPGDAAAQNGDKLEIGDGLAAPAELHDCCKKSQSGRGFCCDQCCATENCDRDEQCPSA